MEQQKHHQKYKETWFWFWLAAFTLFFQVCTPEKLFDNHYTAGHRNQKYTLSNKTLNSCCHIKNYINFFKCCG